VNALETSNLTLAYNESVIINQLDLQIPKGKITVLIGSNGCGKSTLLRSLARLLKPKEGAILLEAKDMLAQSTKEIAKKLAILPQSPIAPEGLTVLQLVKQGRFPYQNWLRQWSEQDESAVINALESTNTRDFAEKQVEMLSGGQRQRAWIAMVLAQGTEVILLDEPTTYLDLSHQIEVLDILFDLNKKEQRTIVMVLHDLNLACRYADYIVTVHNKTVYSQGSAEEVMTEDMVRVVFNMESRIIKDPVYGTPMCIPISKTQKPEVS
jgi:iron complex transport system ATP-binding protein